METRKTFLNGIWYNNPILIMSLGLCPVLAVTVTAVNGIAIGLITGVVLIISNVTISLGRKFLPTQIRVISYLILVSFLVTAFKLLLHAYAIELYNELGIYLSIVAVNCLILNRAEHFAIGHHPLETLADSSGFAIGYLTVTTFIGTIRELLGSGTLTLSLKWGHYLIGGNLDLTWLTQFLYQDSILQVKFFHPLLLLLLPAGGFMVTGLFMAFYRFLTKYHTKLLTNQSDEFFQ